MPIKLANAPVSWGVDYADDPHNPSWAAVMNEIAGAGYRFTELGPYGYYPTKPERLREEFAKRDLEVVAAFVFQPLHDPDLAEDVLGVVRRTVELLAAVGGDRLVTIDHISPERMATAGCADVAKRLDKDRFAKMTGLIERIADTALAHGVTPVIHQHAGCYIEFEDEIEAVLAALDPDKVGLCIDTGHMAYAGIDPVKFYRAHASRTKYFHFKDIDPQVHRRVVSERIPFLDAVAMDVFCPMGRGVVDWAALGAAMHDEGYRGAATVEQDIDPTVSFEPKRNAEESLAYLRSLGF